MSPPSSLGAAISVVFFFTLSIAVPAALYRVSDHGTLDVSTITAWVISAYSGARLAYVCVTGEKRLLSLTFWIFAYVWMGLAPLYQYCQAALPLPGFYTGADAVQTFAVLAIGIVAYELGYAGSRGKADFGFRVFEEKILGRRLVPGRLFIATVCSFVALVGLVSFLGGWRVLLASRGDLVARTLDLINAEGVAYFLIFTSLLRVPICVVYFLALYFWKHRATLLPQNLRPTFPLVLVVIVGLNLFVNNPVNAPRYWIGTIVLGTLFLLLPNRPKYLLSIGTFLLLVALVLVFPHADVFRTESDPAAIGSITWSVELQGGDFDAYQQLMNAGLYVTNNGISFGRQLVGAVCFWVPRSLWQNKPVSSGQLVAVDTGYSYTNLSMPLWGEAYLDGSYFAVVLVFLAYGFFIGKTERLYLRERFVAGTAGAVGVPIFAAYQLFLLRGALMSGVAYLFPIILMLAACTYFHRTDRGVPRSTPR